MYIFGCLYQIHNSYSKLFTTLTTQCFNWNATQLVDYAMCHTVCEYAEPNPTLCSVAIVNILLNELYSECAHGIRSFIKHVSAKKVC